MQRFTKTFTALALTIAVVCFAGCTKDNEPNNGDLPSNGDLPNNGTFNDHDYVNLGLPSGTLWATTNVGAYTPEEYGYYFAWGETRLMSTYNWGSYKYAVNGDYNKLTKYCNDEGSGYNRFTDDLTTLEASDDAATVNWGAGWRMPTEAELQELNNKCTVTWVTQNGVNGSLFTGPNGNSIFLPAAGNRLDGSLEGVGSYADYWSSSLDTNAPEYAWRLLINQHGTPILSDDRCNGLSVRPVCSVSPK